MKRINLIIVLSLALLLCVSRIASATATTYYFDALLGNDSNNGTSIYTPFLTANKASNVAAGANSVFAFHCGQAFRGSNLAYVLSADASANETTPLTYTSYGDCAYNNPAAIDGSDCEGQSVGDCRGATAVSSWAIDTGAIYKLAYANEPYAVYLDSEKEWPSLAMASCETGVCLSVPHGGSVEPSGMLPFFVTSHAYTAGDAVMNQLGQWYTAGSTATSGVTTPTGYTTSSDGTITWTFRGPSAALATTMGPGTWWWNGTNLYIWLASGDSPNNHVIEVADKFVDFNIQANGAEKNNITIDWLALKHGGSGLSIYSNNSGGNIANETIRRSIITQNGTSLVDDGQFLNGSWASEASRTTVNNTYTDNVYSFNGGHGSLTITCGDGQTITNNDVSHATHGGINIPIACSGITGMTIQGNLVHDINAPPFANIGPIGTAPTGIYSENGGATASIVSDNWIWNIGDQAGCTVGTDCGAFYTNGESGISFINNHIWNVFYGLIEGGGGSAGPILHNDIRILSSPNLNTYAVTLGDAPTGPIDHNYYITPYSVSWSVLGVNKTFAQWQTAGYDKHPQSAANIATNAHIVGLESRPPAR